MDRGLIDQWGNPLPTVQRQAGEGTYRPGPYWLPVSGGFLSAEAGRNWNWWQMGYDVQSVGNTAMVEACVSAYAQTISMCPGDHWLALPNNGRERQKLSALTRVLRRPNDYQSISDFLLNAVRHLFLEGNSYALALRNNRFEVSSLHLFDPRSSFPIVAPNGDIFYSLSGNEIIESRIEGRLIIPARDVLHLRLHTPEHPLRGETPLVAAAPQMAAGNAALQQQIAFYLNQSRPSFVLSTDLPLNEQQIADLRDHWKAQSAGLAAGGTPVLTNGVKPHPIQVSARDAQLAEMLGLNDQAVANVFGVPLQLFGMGGTPFSSTEALMQFWRNRGLGFVLNHIEEAIGNFFGLVGQPDEYLEFSTKALMRSAFKERIEGLARGVQTGIFAPNEARAEEELPRAKDGDEPRVQEQVVPLSYGAQKEPNPTPAPAPDPEPDDEDEDEPDDDEAQRHIVAHLQSRAAQILRRTPA